jgi:hypothetical protein
MTSYPYIDRVVRVAPVGLRFWDSISRSFIGVGLRVTAYPAAKPTRRYEATTSVSNTYLLRGLPLLGDYEFANATREPARQYPLVVEVEDTLGRFLAFTCIVRVPVGGFANLDCAQTGSPPEVISLGRIPLFSAPSRRVATPTAAVYARLVYLRTNPQTGREEPVPAAWALVEVQQGGTILAQGIADRDGNAALFFPHPPFVTVSTLGSPPRIEDALIPVQRWTIQLRAFHTLLDRVPPLPDLCRVLRGQTPLRLWRLNGVEALGSLTLEYGTELVVRSVDAASPMNPLSILAVST